MLDDFMLLGVFFIGITLALLAGCAIIKFIELVQYVDNKIADEKERLKTL